MGFSAYTCILSNKYGRNIEICLGTQSYSKSSKTHAHPNKLNPSQRAGSNLSTCLCTLITCSPGNEIICTLQLVWSTMPASDRPNYSHADQIGVLNWVRIQNKLGTLVFAYHCLKTFRYHFENLFNWITNKL